MLHLLVIKLCYVCQYLHFINYGLLNNMLRSNIKIIFTMSALLLMANGHAGDTSNKAANQEPVSLGAYFGSLSQFQPSAKVLAIYAEGDVSFTTLQTMIAQNKVPTDYIHRTRREQIGRLLEFAKKLAIEYNAPAFAVANMQINTIFTSHEIIVETWGDLLAIQP